jgi:protein Tex
MINSKNLNYIAREFKIKESQVKTVLELLSDGATVPFIARYRKEAIGELDEVAVLNIKKRMEELQNFDSRVKTILKSLEDQHFLTPELEDKVYNAESLAVLEDIYLPFKPKRRTRAMAAREKGLQELADFILQHQRSNVLEKAELFVNTDLSVLSVGDALAGARDIIAENISENSELRAEIREYFQIFSALTSRIIKGKEIKGQKYKDYFEWSENISRLPSHRILAIFRGNSEGFLRMHILPEEERAVRIMKRYYLKVSGVIQEDTGGSNLVMAVEDSYKRLLAPSMETEMKKNLKIKADKEAIKVFGSNLEELLLEAPIGQQRVLAIDPGLRTGCKIVCLDSSGRLLKNDTVYLLPPADRIEKAGRKIEKLVNEYKIQAIAVGNGTGGREALDFCRGLQIDKSITINSVNENGASIYSASEAGREEFPNHDLTVRGSVSIGRRLMDPLSELIKIDPKSIGVGQYQHDVDQKELKESLDNIVMSCVNRVGVEINTASSRLLQYVSGLSVKLASNIIKHRDKNGPFKSRQSLLAVNGMGDKSFQQAAGFLRIRSADNPLDNSAVHPESYHIVERMAANIGIRLEDFIENEENIKEIVLEDYLDDKTGLPTIKDIISELRKPGRDPRENFSAFSFKDGIASLNDLAEGMILPGIITNVTAFGAFADIGVHQDGLIHISQLSDKFVKDPMDIAKVNQKVSVRVMSVDLERKRISLSMKDL